MCVQNDMLTIAGEARRQNDTHPNRSRKRSPVRQCGVPDSSRRAAACADSQNFTCARHVRNWLPYRLTFRFVVILRLRRREFDTGPRLHLTVPFPTVPIGLYACTGAARRDIDLASTHGKARSKPARAARSVPIWPGRARIVQRADRIRPENAHLKHSLLIRPGADEGPTHGRPATNDSRKHSPQRKNAAQQWVRKWLPKNLTVTAAVSKIPISSDTYAQKAFGGASRGAPRKASPFDGYPSYDNRMSPPENSHLCQKVAQQKRDFFQSWRAFRRIPPLTGPAKPHL